MMEYIIGVDCNVSPTLLMKKKKARKLYWRILLREVKEYIYKPQVSWFNAPSSSTWKHFKFIFVYFCLLWSCFLVLWYVVQIFTFENVSIPRSWSGWEWNICVVTIFAQCLFSSCRFWQRLWFFLQF
jgi:uncharacterized membrane protein